MEKPELLSPVGDFECLKAAVQNGADSVYLGASLFNARARATNFDMQTLKEAITYAKIRNVKVHVTLNILLKNTEFEDAVKLAVDVYNLGADALIIQDLGLLTYLLKHYPEIPIHSSTQSTTHNLEGVKQLENIGVKRVVLARELSISEIENICKNSNIEIETFIHGALCICYSGQCLFSSIIGGRSGNRGLCAQPCRLPYTLIDEKENILDKGYLLSPKDLNSINYLKKLITAGVKCFKIEGRLKSPEYVGIITRFYRKYIDLICNNATDNELLKELNKKNKNTNLTDLEEITQVFNRGGFSEGHLSNNPNKNLICKEKPDNTGFYLGKIEKFNPNKGYITLKAKTPISIGDKLKIDSNIYTISELMINNQNIKTAQINDIVTIGRIKENINCNTNVYKIQSKILNDYISHTFKEDKDFKKVDIIGKLTILKNKPITLEITNKYYNETVVYNSNTIPSVALNKPITKDKIIEQISKTGNTPFEFKQIDLNLEDNLFIPISNLNEIRRNALKLLETTIIQKHINKNLAYKPLETYNFKTSPKTTTLNLLLNILDNNFDYCNLYNIKKMYIPLRYFLDNNYTNNIQNICSKFNTYIYMPSVIRDNLQINLDTIVKNFNIKGFVISNISQIEITKKYNLELIGNYTLNVYNTYTTKALKALTISSLCITPELNNNDTKNLINSSLLPTELMVYGRIPFMTINYCLLGNSNKCSPECNHLCLNNYKYYLKDRLNFKFRIIPDNTSTITTIYNSKITSFDYSNFNVDNVLISILDEKANSIQEIINTVLEKRQFKGNKFCGHFDK